jgi:hypothetical protein
LGVALSLAFSLAGCGEERSLFPTTPGLSWLYRAKIENWRDDATHKLVVTNINREREDGVTRLRRLRHDGRFAYYRLEDDGVVYEGAAAPGEEKTTAAGEQTILKLPPSKGLSWDGGVSQIQLLPQVDCGQCNNSAPTKPLTQQVRLRQVIDDTSATVTVPAGTFTDCVYVRGSVKLTADGGHAVGVINVEVESEDWYAPGVGLVKSVRRERSDNHLVGSGLYTMELEEFRR